MTATAAPANPPYFARTSLNSHSIFLHFLHSCDRGDSKKSITLGKHARTRAYTHTHIHTRTREHTHTHTRIHTHARTHEPHTNARTREPHTNARTREPRTQTREHTNIRTSEAKLTSKHKKRTNQQRLLTRCSCNQFGSLNKNSPRI